MKRILSHAKPYTLQCILGPLFKLAEVCLELMVPLIMADIIDGGIAVGDTSYVGLMSLRLVIQGVLGLACALVAQYFSAKAAVGITTALKHSLFAHIQSLSAPDIDRIGSSTMIARLTTDMDRLQSGINLTLRLLLRSPFVVFGAAIMAFTVDVGSAVIFAVVIPVLSVVVFGIMLLTMPMFKKVQSRTDTVLSHARENLTGVRVMRAFCREDEEETTFVQANTLLVSLQKKVGAVSALMNPLTYIIINLGIIALLQVGAVQVDSGSLTQGQVVAQYNYLALILTELVKMANMIISLSRALACAARIEVLLDQPISILSTNTLPERDETAPAVTFNHVSLTYPGTSSPALHDITFCAPRGSVIGIVGGTGSGKSSLVSLISRTYEATEGNICVLGADVKAYPLDALREKIGIVPQNPTLFRGSVRDNLRYGNQEAADADLNRALTIAQAKGIVDRFENGLDEQIATGGTNLSGGQKQRLTIARAIVRDPDILILDDASSALDFATDRDLRKALKALENTTVFIISQRTSSISHADLILVLEDGALVGQGKHEDLLVTCPVYREIHQIGTNEEVSA